METGLKHHVGNDYQPARTLLDPGEDLRENVEALEQ